MKTLFFAATFIVLSALNAIARPNILCFYSYEGNVWRSGYLFSMREIPALDGSTSWKLGHASVSVQGGESPTDALCSRSVDLGDTRHDVAVIEQAHYIVDEFGGLDPQSCNWEGLKPYQTISRKTMEIQPGQYASVIGSSVFGGNPLQMFHYAPTDQEIATWENEQNITLNAEYLIRNHCTSLFPGSRPWSTDLGSPQWR